MQELESSVLDKVNSWINGSYDEATKDALRKALENKEYTELTDAFYKDLEFGTGGLRGIMGIGSNRVNKYTFGIATQGLCNFLNKTYPTEEIKVVIAHDNRNNSNTLAQLVADVFSANGIYVYFFDGLRPTPELSFAIRELGCKSGVMLTASHNPKEYNGYKAYGHDGGQLTIPHDEMVMDEVRAVNGIEEVKFEGNPQLIEKIGAEIDEQYLSIIAKESISKDAISRQSDMKIVFSPIHGTGSVLVPPLLERMGFKNVILVEEQMVVDGNFPTVVYPNPEEAEALSMAIAKAKETGADLVMATDPDADRVGIAIRDDKGELVLMNGNQTAVLLFGYVLDAWKQAGKLDGNQYIVKTIVTTYLLDKMAASMDVDCYNTLTGFKHIGSVMTKLEGQKTFIVGGEESYGYLVGEHARDKDAVVACGMIAEMAAFYKDQGSSLYEALMNTYVKHGLYKESLISLTKKGKSGAEEIQAMLASFRKSPPASFAASKVITVKDYKDGTSTDIISGDVSKIDLPSSNVLQFFTEDGSIISARPSGTEPKIKFYCSVNAPVGSRNQIAEVAAVLDKKIEQIRTDLGV
ncbi:MAG: phosphoglucomutase [Saprospiraceae bacterium]|jgi:phosphoglucomutase